MTWNGHVAATAMIMPLTSHPLLVLFWGFVSHALLDITMPEHREKGLILTKPTTWMDHKGYLLWQVSGVLFCCWLMRSPLPLFGVLPDMIEGVYVWAMLHYRGKNVWMTGDLFFPFHRPQYHAPEEWTKRQTVLVEAFMIGLVMLLSQAM